MTFAISTLLDTLKSNIAFNNDKKPTFIENLLNTYNSLNIFSTAHCVESEENARPRYFKYIDSCGTGKTYLKGETWRIGAAHTPFEPDILNYLTGNNPKAKIMVTHSAVKITMEDPASGNKHRVRADFLQYRGPKGTATIMPDGEVDISDDQYIKRNMLPGMERKPGEFAIYEIPEKNMIQPREKFSSHELVEKIKP